MVKINSFSLFFDPRLLVCSLYNLLNPGGHQLYYFSILCLAVKTLRPFPQKTFPHGTTIKAQVQMRQWMTAELHWAASVPGIVHVGPMDKWTERVLFVTLVLFPLVKMSAVKKALWVIVTHTEDWHLTTFTLLKIYKQKMHSASRWSDWRFAGWICWFKSRSLCVEVSFS